MQIQGWHILIFFGMAIAAVVVIVIIAAVAGAARRRRLPESSARPAPSPSDTKKARLAELDDLRRGDVISEDEYRKARADILRG